MIGSVKLRELAERGFHLLPAVPGYSEGLHLRGITGRISPISHPIPNRCGLARARDAEGLIDRVLERYGRSQNAFMWVTGPTSRPQNLSHTLEAAGITQFDYASAMVREVDGAPLVAASAADAIEVRAAALRDLPLAAELLRRGFGWPQPVAAWFVSAHWAARRQLPNRGYLAFVGDVPVGYATLIAVPGQPFAQLGGAATVPEARGTGVYTRLVAHRLAVARRQGCVFATVQARTSTSAPILASLGFRELARLNLHAWQPQSHTDPGHAAYVQGR